MMVVVLFALAMGAAIATFIENDFGTAFARKNIYHALWYQGLLLLSALNLLLIIHRTKLYKQLPKFIFHLSFVLILIGASLTHFLGDDGVMKIREGSSSHVYFSNDKSHEVILPFALRLDDFELTRYYGSRSPSAYSSHVTILDKAQHDASYTISMNHPLSYQGYKFFQTFYDPDEKGTILSVNHDPGVEVTYAGYFFLFLGLLLNFFDTKSRFRKLMQRVRATTLPLFLMLVCVSQMPLHASEYIDTYMQEHRDNSKELSASFGELVVQSRMGRMKPFATLSQEVIYKISGKKSLYDMDATQIVLGMFTRPTIWKKIPLIKVKTPKLKHFIGLDTHQSLASFSDFFENGQAYKLEAEVQKALALKPSQRGTFENDVIKVDEKLNITFMVYQGLLFKIFPSPQSTNHVWLDFEQMWQSVDTKESEALRKRAKAFLDTMFSRDYAKANAYVEDFAQYQRTYGYAIMPTQQAVKQEIMFNKVMIFERLTLAYMGFGLMLLVVSFGRIFKPKAFSPSWDKPLWIVVLLLFSVHTLGLGARWFVSGHAPMSDTYESIIYIAWSCLLFSVLFLRKSLLALSGSVLMAGIFMFVAHLGHIDPEITNLVPVLKSFWLSVHVSIITASYGFLGLGCALGFFTLILFIFKPSSVDKTIKHLTDINELTLLIGLVLLVIGNFLGGIWANESWGRYWGWDPKETWAYISILLYTIILHVRLLPKFYSPYLFAVLSVLGYASILMTYFGVNFYLAGMHSYATGDPVPIPLWVYGCCTLVAVLISLSFNNRNLKENNEEN
ncbi:MAG: cytochrome c biogenesis protein CcsA [Sulfurospirillaceae bacterium]|nr:cytochrome c biogenesis protein CcsA [Sulfurospirillaceae bacterium]